MPLGQPAPSLPAGRGGSRRLILQPPSPRPCFTSRSPSADQSTLRFSLHSLKCSQRATRCCQQPLATGTGDRVIPITATSLSHLVGSADLCHFSAPHSHTGSHPGAWVCRAPLPLAKVLLGLPLLGIACSCPWMEVDGSTWHSGGDCHRVGAGGGDIARPLLGGHKVLVRLLTLSTGENTVIRRKEGKY